MLLCRPVPLLALIARSRGGSDPRRFAVGWATAPSSTSTSGSTLRQPDSPGAFRRRGSARFSDDAQARLSLAGGGRDGGSTATVRHHVVVPFAFAESADGAVAVVPVAVPSCPRRGLLRVGRGWWRRWRSAAVARGHGAAGERHPRPGARHVPARNVSAPARAERRMLSGRVACASCPWRRSPRPTRGGSSPLPLVRGRPVAGRTPTTVPRADQWILGASRWAGGRRATC
jgi:hypothetical protein